MKRNPMTMRGAEMLRAELKKLKSEDRPNVIKAIAEARSHGDLSENAEYHAAREQQGFIEGRINEIEAKLSTADVIDVSQLAANGKVVFGTTVDLEAEEDGKKVTYTIVGEDEADIRAARIAVTSPIARALIGKSEGDVVDVAAPGGTRSTGSSGVSIATSGARSACTSMRCSIFSTITCSRCSDVAARGWKSSR